MSKSVQVRNPALSRVSLCILAFFFAAEQPRAQTAELEAVVVTATRRETLLQNTPESIQALSAEFMDEVGVDDFLSYFRFVPNLDQSDNRGPGNARYSIRGVVSGGEPLVSVYFDEIPGLGSPGQTLDPGGSQPDIKLWDVERVEVLKGPQGTLYGSGSMGGTIRVISSKPDASRLDFAGKADFETIRHGGWGFSQYGMVNVPLIEDRLAIRLTGYHRNVDGYINEFQFDQDDANDEDTVGGRVSLRWTPTDRLTFTASGYFQDTESGAEYEIFRDLTKELGTPTAHTLLRAPFDDEIQLYNLTAEYEFDWANLSYTTAYQRRRVVRTNDTSRLIIFGSDFAGFPPALCPPSALKDGSCLAIINAGPFGRVVPAADYAIEVGQSRIHEVRLVSSLEGPFDYTIGVFYENRNTRRWGQVAVPDANGELEFNADGSAKDRLFARMNNGSRDHYAAYGELGYKFLPNWRAAFGFRWFKTDREERQNLVQNFGPGPTGQQPTEEASKDNWVKRFTVSWDVSKDVLVYATAAEGFRVGGPNQPVGFVARAPSYGEDSLWTYEFGWKTSWLDDTLRVNGAAFYIDWSNIQYITSTSDGAFTVVGNAGDAEVTGFEMDLQAVPLVGLELGLGIGYSRARFAGTQPRQALLQNQTEDGDRLPGVPDWSTTLYGKYTRPLMRNLEGFVGGDWSYHSSKTTGLRPEAGDFKKLPGYHQANLYAGVSSEHWRLMLSVDNVFDALPELSGRIVLSDPFQFASLQPRTIGLTVQYNY